MKDPIAGKRVTEISEIINLLKENLNKTKETYKKYADQRRMVRPSFEVGDKVWLLKGVNIKNRKKKLSNQMIGLFRILKKVSNLAYELDLPKEMRCHPVFHVSLLEPFYENEFPDRTKRKRRNISLTTDYIEKTLERISDVKVVNGKNFYFVSWKDCDIENNSWIEESQIPDKQLIQEFERRLRKGKQPAKDDELDEAEYYVRHNFHDRYTFKKIIISQELDFKEGDCKDVIIPITF